MREQSVEMTLDDFNASSTGTMEVRDVRGNPTGWLWEFAGPGHPQTEALNSKLARERLHRQAQMEAAQVNGRRWSAEESDPDATKVKNISNVVQRIVGWSPITIDGAPFPFSPENATEFLSHPKRIGVLAQVMEFLASEGAFTQRSE